MSLSGNILDELEPYSTAASVTIAVPTFVIAIFTYTRIYTNVTFRANHYMRLFVCKGVHEMFLYLMNLLEQRLPLQPAFFGLYAALGLYPAQYAVEWILGGLYAMAIFSPFLYGISLSLNRYLAIAHPSVYRMIAAKYIYISLVLIYFFSNICVPRMWIYNLYYVPVPSRFPNTTIILFYSVNPASASLTAFFSYFNLSIYLASSCVELFINILTLFSIIRERKKIGDMKGAGATAAKKAERGLYITTVCTFLVNVIYTIAQVLYRFFPVNPVTQAFMKGNAIIIDMMALTPIYLLLTFSPSLRRTVFHRSRNSTKMTVISSGPHDNNRKKS